MKKISLIVPVYNLEDCIGRCLNSILDCKWPALEIICVNDGSSDGSLAVLESFQKTDRRIRILNQRNRGVSAARNYGLAEARGEYIGFVDGDDVLHPDCLEVLAQMLERKRADIAVCDYRAIRGDDFLRRDPEKIGRIRILDAAKSMKVHTVKCFVWGRLYRKEILTGLRFREDMALGEDRAFHLDLLCAHPDVRIAWTAEKLYGYCQREASAVACAGKVQWLKLAGDILNGCQAEEDTPGKALYFTESFKLACAVRELCRQEPELLPEAQQLVRQCLLERKKITYLAPARRFGYLLMGKMPVIYRCLLAIKKKLAGSD